MQRVLDWFAGLSTGRKALAVLFGVLLVFSVANLLIMGGLELVGYSGNEEPPASAQRGDAPGGEAAPPEPSEGVEITRAEWAGEKVVVEGEWSGEISSVYCDLFEGSAGKTQVTDWWDRSKAAAMNWSERTFTQEFAEAEGRETEDAITPQAPYSVACTGTFSEGLLMRPSAEVRGAPSS